MTQFEMNHSVLREAFVKLGTVVEVEGNRPLIIHDEFSLYYVQTGHVELFAVPLRDGTITDKRSYLFRADNGQVIYGMHQVHAVECIGLLATGASGTQLIKAAKSELLGELRKTGQLGILADSLDEWINLWSNALKTRNNPIQFTQIESGTSMDIPSGTNLRSVNKVLWIGNHDAKSLLWIGEQAGRLQGEQFPLSGNSWLLAESEQQISAYTTAEWLQADERWRGLAHFHNIVYEALQLKLKRAEEMDLERLQRKRANDRRFMSQAVDQITSVTQGAAKKTSPSMIGTDPLYQACDMIGKELDVEIKPLSDKIISRSRNPVEDIAKASGIRTRQVALKGQWWTEDNGPMLAFMEEDGRAVALLQKNPKSYELYDPLQQTRTPVTAQIAHRLNPFAHTFYRPLPSHALSVKDIMKFGAHKSLYRDVMMMIIMGVAGGLLGMVTPIATGILFDNIIPEAERGQLVQMTMILFVVSVSILLFGMTRSMAMLRIEGRMDSSIQAAVWDRLLNLPVPFFRDYSAGDLAMRANSINTIRQAISGVALTTIFSGIFSSFNFFLLFYYDVKLALVALVLVVISILMTSGMSLLQIRYQRILTAVQGKISGLVLQILNGITKFRVTGAENRAFFLWANLFSEQKRTAFTSRTISNILAVFNAMFPVITSIVLFYIVIMSGSSALSAGKFLAFFAAFSSFLTAMLSMSGSLISIVNIVPVYERAKPILQAIPEVHEAMADPGELTGAVEVSHLSFRYHEDQQLVLRDVSFQIKPGEFVALIGSSGCGKSTLLRLLLGFEKPVSGSVYYDGQDLKTLDVRSLRSQLGVVLQNGKLMSGDIFTNIVGSSNLTIDDAWEAARLAGFDEDVKEMPMGMHTVISEGGGTLSGGQRQRLLIARAIARKPRIIYFDEATSALDNRTQAIVSESLEKLEATRVVIAHRLSTIMNADRIFVLDKGEIIQTGTYHELLNQEGLFAELAKRQLA